MAAAGLSGPVDGILADGQVGARRLIGRREVDAREVHRQEAAGVFSEVGDGVADGGHRRHLELHFDQLGVEALEQDFIGEAAINGRHFEALVVEEKLDAGFGGGFGDMVVLIGGRAR